MLCLNAQRIHITIKYNLVSNDTWKHEHLNNSKPWQGEQYLTAWTQLAKN